MQPKDIILTGPLTTSGWWYNTPLGTSVSTFSSKRHRVSPGTSNNMQPHNIPKNWSYWVETSKNYVGEKEWTNGAYLYKSSGIQDASFPTYPAWDKTLVYNRALEKLNAKARGELDLGIALAEAGATMRMTRSLSKVIDFARIRRLGSTKDLANGWLQWQYGWRPLVSDVFNAADEAIRIVLNKLERISARASIPYESIQSIKRPFWGQQIPLMVNVKGKVSCTIGVTYTVPTFDPARWSSLNPISLAWELIPYSFVVDWFYDVGGWLRAMETGLLYGAAFKHGYVSELRRYESKETALGYKWSSGGYNYTLTKMEGSVRRIDFLRTAIGTWPLPRKPTFKVDLGAQRMVSAAALLRQLLKG